MKKARLFQRRPETQRNWVDQPLKMWVFYCPVCKREFQYWGFAPSYGTMLTHMSRHLSNKFQVGETVYKGYAGKVPWIVLSVQRTGRVFTYDLISQPKGRRSQAVPERWIRREI